MKYVIILAIVVLFSRIDFLLGLFEKVGERLRSEQSGADISESMTPRDVIPVTGDRSLKRTNKDIFLALLENFQSSPVEDIRNRAMSVLKENPTLFSEKLDPELESHIFRWRDLLNNNEPEVVNFILGLQETLKGENLEMLNRFFALWMEINMEHFLAAYVKTKDSACNIATVFGDKIPEEELLNEYVERQDALTAILAKENVSPVIKELANNCSLQLKIVIEKMAPPSFPDTEQTIPSTTISPDPNAPAPTP